YWHTFKGLGADPFGPGTMIREWNNSSDPMAVAEMTLRAAFELFSKLGVQFWCFHDRDVAPEGRNLAETNGNLDRIVKLARKLQRDTGIKPLWGTANLFSNRRYLAGAATNPSPQVFAYAAAQVKKAMEVTKTLGGSGYVFWGGREGYDTLLNTDMGRELDHLGRFLHMAVDYKKKIRFGG
ncbi:MAG: xylose isomerase, partial [bacterium]|nr:xylose isomerase [bacterium]